ncbi:hypothetical protein FA95DRAFT_1498923 [Auriscalpium vulgare]|uniref:Uncharacterized protein n=1 Tax=Auriscalpium vulgare TaxID=40419 RepID=A0ACB8RHK2_9AGAM|nr:hypothetical protein FA95DRAFT_1498923 [Auriscalpium vulgare]
MTKRFRVKRRSRCAFLIAARQTSYSPVQAALQDAEELKQEGNDYFRSSSWNEAFVAYRRALRCLPQRQTFPKSSKGKEKAVASSDDDDEGSPRPDPVELQSSPIEVECARARAILNANIGACHVKQGAHEEAAKACTEALLDDPEYVKALQRRAQSNEKIGSWSALSSAQDDYNKLLAILPPSSPHVDDVKRSLRLLQPRLESQQKQEMDEMLGKLKGIGNSILGKFGLSTDNFKMDPNGQGGYSMNFTR